MASSPEYVFSRDHLDNNRINLQHYLVVQLFGYRIHPSIPTQSPDLRIADCWHRHRGQSKSSSIWLTDLAGELPKSARLDTLDISFAAAPLPEMLPPSVSLHQWDVKTDVSEHLMGVYDVVHLRFFAFVIQEYELDAILERLLKLLTWGYIQWTDIDISSLRLEKIRPDIQADAQVKLMNQFKGNDNRLDSAWAPPHLALALHEVGLLATEVLTRNKASSGTEEVARVMKRTLAQAAKETRDGSYLAFTRYTVVARKKDPA
ncbi:hypothetical protein BDV37DRAFT_267760 [Aspergillus pseudonomiae]|uniref:Methyltransferase domain-containing protein n=1 Tax=Aspergillus pseudonomiae TaxID=1506151 RepID=A0A5N7DU52_9EURO|nr:uncharacterized protein BDV37DRAFT_267760 [Aspergillus pseudonomiae]KAE8409563.1 hypothetical protein BDV37DRAFT_267760 [Aspergillus pseudonomiae]